MLGQCVKHYFKLFLLGSKYTLLRQHVTDAMQAFEKNCKFDVNHLTHKNISEPIAGKLKEELKSSKKVPASSSNKDLEIGLF